MCRLDLDRLYVHTCTHTHTLLSLSDIAISARDQMNHIVDIKG